MNSIHQIIDFAFWLLLAVIATGSLAIIANQLVLIGTLYSRQMDIENERRMNKDRKEFLDAKEIEEARQKAYESEATRQEDDQSRS